MTKQDPWFFEERAVEFSSLLLTTRDDVKVQPHTGGDGPLELLAEVLQDGKPTLRFFGVKLIPYLDLPDIPEAEERVRSLLGRNSLDGALPLCVFVIGVRRPEGIYRWIVEPVVEDGRASLRRNGEPNWQPLDEAEVARLIDRVKNWYDVLNGDSPPKRSRRGARL
jgi:hypothetical protein